jgi:hypothetical protein
VTGEGSDLEGQIVSACRALGKTEEQLGEWLRKKYGAASVAELTRQDQREVLQFLQSRADSRAA